MKLHRDFCEFPTKESSVVLIELFIEVFLSSPYRVLRITNTIIRRGSLVFHSKALQASYNSHAFFSRTNSTKKLRLDSSQFFDTTSHATESVAKQAIPCMSTKYLNHRPMNHEIFGCMSLNTSIEYVSLTSESVFVLYGVNIPYRPKTPVKRKFKGFTGVFVLYL